MQYTRWNQPLTSSCSFEVTTQLALWHISHLGDEELAECLTKFILDENYAALCNFDVDYSRLTLGDARHLRQILAFFQKRKDLEIGVDKRAVALSKFWQSEVKCCETNDLFRKRAAGVLQIHPLVERVLLHASRKIAAILGEVPKLSTLRPRFGPGATTQLTKRTASPRAKLGSAPACSIELSRYAEDLLTNEMPEWWLSIQESLPHGASFPLVIHPGKLALVPKSAKEFRSVMVEPSLNTMWQAGIGSYMAERLRSCGVDIRDQSRNQRLARKGSIDGTLATVDLASASDTVSIELVYDLLGSDWFSFLRKFRTGACDVEGTICQLQKFSSMGNGFTFPLETLLFYGIAFGVCVELGLSTQTLSVYGDDIIIDARGYALLHRVLHVVGFEVNSKKSFESGPFRESCGKDYYLGTDIRPLYIKEQLAVFDLFRIHNFYYESYMDETVCEFLQSFLDPSIRLYGPPGFGDGHLLGKWVPSFKSNHLKRGYGGAIFETFRFRPVTSLREYPNGRILPLYSTYLSEVSKTGDEVTSSAEYTRDGRLRTTVPGRKGFDRISIYTFAK